MPYRAPLPDIRFALDHAAGLEAGIGAGMFADLADGTADSILGEAAKFAEGVLDPINRNGDLTPPVLREGQITTSPGWVEAYGQWIEGGWSSLAAPGDFGGMGLPHVLSAACLEMWTAANMAFMLCPILSDGAILALSRHATPELQETWLPKIVSGEWPATMNLTEPQAGSDLNALRARAERNGDGTYKIFGQKIYITYGEHDMSGNIVHLVLARLPDAPAGTRGISLFLVPKFLPGPDGAQGAANDVRCAGLEHKMGIHGSPTCTMIYGDNGGATGWLVGEENRGLACMFTMMNNARLSVGLQGVGAAERATQQALDYARERRQGRPPGWSGEGMAPITAHADVQRMLMTMKSLTAAARAICYLTAAAADEAHRAQDANVRAAAQERASLLTPLAKAFSTDIGNEVTSLGVQVHGGMGF
ncbi:MAG: acyl-CoA dehydrogenase family protein, partial [Beijerinckiaceae bacterium]